MEYRDYIQNLKNKDINNSYNSKLAQISQDKAKLKRIIRIMTKVNDRNKRRNLKSSELYSRLDIERQKANRLASKFPAVIVDLQRQQMR